MQHHSRRLSATMLGLLALALTLSVASMAQATKLKRQNLTQLIAESQSIVAGTVTSVTDGIADSGMPYTEVTIEVGSVAKGPVREESTYTFRQFGLLAPKTMPNGHNLLAVTPEGFPRWVAGEYAVAFLYRPAARTGLQTTAGLAQGKLSLVNGMLVNDFGNEGMFEGVEIDETLLSDAERNMLIGSGPVDAAVFMDLVGRAVAEGWIENGEMQ